MTPRQTRLLLAMLLVLLGAVVWNVGRVGGVMGVTARLPTVRMSMITIAD